MRTGDGNEVTRHDLIPAAEVTVEVRMALKSWLIARRSYRSVPAGSGVEGGLAGSKRTVLRVRASSVWRYHRMLPRG